MRTEIRRLLRQWLAVVLIAALVLDGFALTAFAGDDGDWAATGLWPRSQLVQAEDDDDDEECEIEDDDGNPATDGFCRDQIMVRLSTGADPNNVNEAFGTETIDAIEGQRLYLLRLPRNSDEASFVAQFESDARVAWAELNFVDQAPEGSPRRFYPSSGDAPRPGVLAQAYAPALLGVPAARACATGDGVTVAVIDSGLDPDHPAFDTTTLRDAWNAFSNQDGLGNVDDIGNSEDDDGDSLVDEMTGHGTHVAGIVIQIAPGAAIMPIKALDSDGAGQAFYLARAIYRALDYNAAVINLSLGSTANTRVVREATANAIDAGIFVTAAAGNAGPTGLREYPATLDGVFGVVATDEQDRPADFTSRHASLALSAPGAEIVSAFAIDQPPSDKLGSPYALWSGTSMATPWVAGAAALLLDQHPGWSPAEIAARLRNSAAPINGSGAGMGSGRLDAAAAIGCQPQAQPDDDGKNDKKNKKGKKGKKRRHRR
jgi:thermitase